MCTKCVGSFLLQSPTKRATIPEIAPGSPQPPGSGSSINPASQGPGLRNPGHRFRQCSCNASNLLGNLGHHFRQCSCNASNLLRNPGHRFWQCSCNASNLLGSSGHRFRQCSRNAGNRF